MRIHDRRPVVWPDDRVWQLWWREQVRQGEASLTERGGAVSDEGEFVGELLRGEHLRPGAQYLFHTPELTRAKLTGDLPEGAAQAKRRDFSLDYREHGEQGKAARLVFQGLDRLERVEVGSTLKHLGGHGWFAPHQVDVGRLEVALDWAKIQVSVTREQAGAAPAVTPGAAPAGGGVGPTSAGASDLLVVEVDLAGRGRWRAMLAPLLRIARGQVERSVRLAAIEAAAALTAMAVTPPDVVSDTGSASPPHLVPKDRGDADREGREASLRWGTAALQDRFDRIEAQAGGMTRRGRRRSVRRFHHGLPPLDAGSHDVTVSRPWAAVELDLIGQVAAEPRAQRRAAWDQALRDHVDQERAGAAPQGSVGADQNDGSGSAEPTNTDSADTSRTLHPEDDIRTDDGPDLIELTDETVDLSWLASPRTTIKKMMS